jgi:hypothetical protein
MRKLGSMHLANNLQVINLAWLTFRKFKILNLPILEPAAVVEKKTKFVVFLHFRAMMYKLFEGAQAAWRSGHHIRLRNEKTRVRIPPG